MMDELLKIILENKTSVIGGTLAICFVAYLAWRNNNKNRFAEASSKFRNIVLSTLKGLYPLPTEWPQNELAIIEELEKRFPDLQAAVSEFRFHLFWRKKLFDRAWHIYRLGKDGRDVDHQYYWQYIPTQGAGIVNGKVVSDDNRQNYKKNLKQNIDRLLSYAEPNIIWTHLW